jgi:putative DNA primase/helicase
MESEDAISAWIEDHCDRDPNAWETSTALFASWKSWATAASEHVGSEKRFTQNLEAHGLTRQRLNKGRGFSGLRLRGNGPLYDR